PDPPTPLALTRVMWLQLVRMVVVPGFVAADGLIWSTSHLACCRPRSARRGGRKPKAPMHQEAGRPVPPTPIGAALSEAIPLPAATAVATAFSFVITGHLPSGV